MNLVFVGGGNMASALIGGLVGKGFASEQIAVIEVDPSARERLVAQLHVATYADDDPQVLRSADVILLAIKPQQLPEAAHALAAHLRAQLVISIAAGIRLADLSRWLGGYRKLVRVMPNTPALVGVGMSGMYALPEVSADEREQAQQLLGAACEILWCAREDMLDAITAVSGSGPAYVYYFVEALEAAARSLGFSHDQARILASQTFAGALELLRRGVEDPATLRRRVTSKGGTTERAIEHLEAAGVKQHIIAAVNEARARAKELGEIFGQHD